MSQKSLAPLIYVVAGASRGIGLALVEVIAAKDSTAIIYAGARNPSSASELAQLAAQHPGRIVIVKYISGEKEGNDTIAKEIGDKHGRVDTLIANAGVNTWFGQVHEMPIKDFEDHFAVNALGPAVLFQSFRDLLKASSFPRFVPISSMVGSLELVTKRPADATPYSVSKAALNWITRKIHFENEWLVAFPQCPGAVYTDMAKGVIAADKTGMFEQMMKDRWRSPDAAANMLIDIIQASTREKDGGQFHTIEGKRHPW
ncbi:NAD(P)-binding protein [Pholiota conissans]|uniref:NAD(P)-binding protein n=1 Tax=Pholiota conissans TaxID=109636 RepID=A0A9P5YTL3_9AGAR|nr:NAD(P)-binding protein [Pholiota conissans]